MRLTVGWEGSEPSAQRQVTQPTVVPKADALRFQLHLCGQIVSLSTATQSLAKMWLLQTKRSVLVTEAELQSESRPKWRHRAFWGFSGGLPAWQALPC